MPLAQSAAFDSFEEQRERQCLAGTQQKLLTAIQRWINDDDGTTVLWLSGMAGTGKSTLSRTTAQALNGGKRIVDEPTTSNESFLGASFFFNQRDATRNNARSLISTVARSLARTVPELKLHIADAIAENRDIASRGLQSQWTDLITGPLSKLNSTLVSRIRLFIVMDALDECEDHWDVAALLRQFASLQEFDHLRVRVMITSRPEANIRLAFQGLPGTLYRCESVRKVQHHDSKDDIMAFLEHELPQIRTKYRHRDDWPGSETIARLHQKADGLFVYASTACRFLDDPWSDSRLEAIFEDDVDGEAPQQSLDAIYARILTYSLRSRPQRERQVILDMCRRILGSIVSLFVPASITTLAQLTSTSTLEAERVLSPLHSIVEMPSDHEGPVGIVHLSFRDFLLNQERCERSPEFWVDAPRAHQDLLARCLDIMEENLHQDMCDLRMPGSHVEDLSQDVIRGYIPLHLQYACRFWIDHLAHCETTRLSEVGLGDDGRIHRFLQKNLLFWLETLSLIGDLTASVLPIQRLEKLVSVTISSFNVAQGFIPNNL